MPKRGDRTKRPLPINNLPPLIDIHPISNYLIKNTMKFIGGRLTGFDVKISIGKKLKIVATLLFRVQQEITDVFLYQCLMYSNLSQKREQGAENCEIKFP